MEITLTGTYTCTHHTDQQRAACPVCLVTALTAERGKLRAELAELHDSFAGNVHTRCNELRDELAAEREKVRVLREALESLAYWSRNRTETRITLRNRIAAVLAATKESS
jgi:hypothetical protein